MSIDERIRRHLQESSRSLTAPHNLEEVMAEGRRRQVRRGTFTVLGAAAVVAAVVTIAPLLFPAEEGGEDFVPVATAPSTETFESTPQTTVPAPEAPLGVVVAGPDGVSALDREGSTTLRLEGDNLLVAFPDQLGGLMYQTASNGVRRLTPGEPTPTELTGAGAVPIGPGRSPAGDPLFYYLEESVVMALDLATGEVSEVTAISESEDVSAGGRLVAVVDRADFECPSLRLIDLAAGEVPSPLEGDCLPVAAGVSVYHDGRYLAVLAEEELEVVAVTGGEILLERSIPGAYMATAGPGGWAVRTPNETVLLAADGESWTLPPVDDQEWVIPFARPFELAEGATLGSAPDEAACSTIEAELSAQDLPEQVAATRQELWEMATSCDVEGLAARAQSDSTILSFGGSDDPAALWAAEAEQGRDPLAILAQLLSARPAEDAEAGLWAWPAVHVDPSDEESWREIEAIVGADLVEAMRQAGIGYTGYRVGIATDGTWQFFVAGD